MNFDSFNLGLPIGIKRKKRTVPSLSAMLWISLSFAILFFPVLANGFHQPPFRPSIPLSESPALWAKKGKGKKKKSSNQNQNSGFAWASSFALKPFESQSLRELASTALASFEARTGKPLAPGVSVTSTDPPKAIWNAPSVACVIMGEDGELKYANLAALEMVALKGDDFERLCPASASITISNKAERPETAAVVLDIPSKMDKKYESGYKKKVFRAVGGEEGKDITILNAHRWTLEKSVLLDGNFVTTSLGIAYAWEQWQVGESIIRSPGGEEKNLGDLAALQIELEKQAALIRKLKEEQGLGNKDPEVVEAVEKLLELKEQIAAGTS